MKNPPEIPEEANSETRTISLVNKQAGAGNVAVSGDLANRLSLTGATATAVSGQNAVAAGNFIQLNSPSNGSLATGDKIQLNGSLSGLKDTNGNAVSGETLFVGSRSGSDQEFALFLTAEDALNNTNALTFTEETNLSGVSVQKVLSEAGTEQVNTSTRLGDLDNLANFSFSVNGADFAFDADTTISTVLSRINGSSSAGVQATFNAETRQISFTNKSTGEGDVTVSGGLADRLGLTSPAASVVSGKNAIATISGGLQDGQVISSRDNTLSASETGVAGLTFTVNGVGSTTITATEGGNRILPDASVVTEGITEFFNQFNKVQAFLEANSEKGGRVFGDIANGLRGSLREVFGNSAISGSIGSTGTSNQFSVDEVELGKGVEAGLSGVLDLFRGPNGAGFAARTSNFLKSYTGSTGTSSQEITRIGRTESSVTSSLASLNQKEENNRKRLNESLAGISKAVISIQIQQGFLSGLGGAGTSSGGEVNQTREGSTGLSLLGQQDQAQDQATAAGITTGSSSGSGFNLENNMSGIENFINGLFK